MFACSIIQSFSHSCVLCPQATTNKTVISFARFPIFQLPTISSTSGRVVSDSTTTECTMSDAVADKAKRRSDTEGTGTRVTRSEATVELSQIESFSPHILEATLRNTNWESVMRDFFRTNSPRFEGFRKILSEGGDYDIQMMSVYNDFMQAVETVVRNQIKIIGITEEKFVEATSRGLLAQDPVSVQLVAFLENRSDFLDFGRMMEDKYIAEYIIPLTSSSTQLSESEGGTTHCRVLWDIENIGVGKKLGGLATIERIQSFLQTKGLFGSGKDCRITAFFNPAHKSNNISKKVVNELDKAAVEIVWVSEKREDADRKLGNRISQELQVLKPQNTTFVIITSDQDFRHHFQLLRSLSYTIIVIHNATESSKWSSTMAMHCSASYHWKDILAGISDSSHDEQVVSPKIDSERMAEAPLPEGWEKKFDTNKNKPFYVNHNDKTTHWQDPRVKVNRSPQPPKVRENNPTGSKSKKGSHPDDSLVSSEEGQATFMREIQAVWFSGVCKKWKNTFGFVKVIAVVDSPLQNVISNTPLLNPISVADVPLSASKDVVPTPPHSKYVKDIIGREIFVHASFLPDGQTELNENDRVDIQISYTKKGLQASNVRAMSTLKASDALAKPGIS